MEHQLFRDLYSQLYNKIKESPDDYVLNNLVTQNIYKLPLEYQQGILSIIMYYHILEMYAINPGVSADEVKNKLLAPSGKRSTVMNLSYGGKSTPTGKGANYDDINKLPIDLQRLIVAYFQMVT